MTLNEHDGNVTENNENVTENKQDNNVTENTGPFVFKLLHIFLDILSTKG